MNQKIGTSSTDLECACLPAPFTNINIFVNSQNIKNKRELYFKLISKCKWKEENNSCHKIMFSTTICNHYMLDVESPLLIPIILH